MDTSQKNDSMNAMMGAMDNWVQRAWKAFLHKSCLEVIMMHLLKQ